MDFTLHPDFPLELEAEWNALLEQSASHVPFLRHEYLHAWWQTRGGGEWPQAQAAVITARSQGRLCGIAPLFHTPAHEGAPCLMFLGSIEISDYLDFIAAPRETAPFLEGLLRWLPGAGLPAWQRLDAYNILEDSPTLPVLEQAAVAAGWKLETTRLQHSPYIPLPGDWDTYLAGIDKKQRHEIRRKMRRAEEAPLPVTWYILHDPARLEADTETFLGLMAHDPEKAAFLTPPMREHMRLTLRCAFESGCMQLAFLEIGGEKAAAYLSFDYLNRVWVYNSGLDRRFNEWSPGWVLLGHLLKWANENGRSEFDFMRGGEDYKYRFGARDRFIVRARLTPPAAV